MNNRIYTFSVLAVAALAAAISVPLHSQPGLGDGSGPGPGGVVISELTVDPPPGSPDTWVEIYNPTDMPADIGGLRIVSLGRDLASVPAATTLPERGLLVIRWVSANQVDKKSESLPKPSKLLDRQKADDAVISGVSQTRPCWPGGVQEDTPARSLSRSFAQRNTAELTVPAVNQTRIAVSPELRPPGEIALVGQRKGQDVLWDYVLFGGYGSTSNRGVESHWRTQADKQGIWRDGEVVFIGTDAGVGGICPVAGPIAAGRIFALRSLKRPSAAWVTLPLSLASPGRGNLLPPPHLYIPQHPARADKGIQLDIQSAVDVPVTEQSGLCDHGPSSKPSGGEWSASVCGC